MGFKICVYTYLATSILWTSNVIMLFRFKVHLIHYFLYILFFTCLCDSIFFFSLPASFFCRLSTSLPLLFSLFFSLHGYIKWSEGPAVWAAEWRWASPLCELSFTKELLSSAAWRTSSASPPCRRSRLFMNPLPLQVTLMSQHTLLFKYYGPSGTFRGNGCPAVLSSASIV